MSNICRKKKNPDAWILYIITFVVIAAVGYAISVVVCTNQPAAEEIVVKSTITPESVLPKETPKPTLKVNPTATSVPTATPVPQIPEHIQKYREENEDTIGYIYIVGTIIDYPVMYSGDNEFYLHNDFDKNPSYHGAVFLDYRCDYYDFSRTRNIILYGHRMRDGTMFRSLAYYLEKKFFDSHSIVQFDTLAGEMQWEVFAIFETHTDFYYINTEFESDEEWVEFIKYCQSLSLYKTEIELSADDIVLTLSTCSLNKDYRVVVMARLISEPETYKTSVK